MLLKCPFAIEGRTPLWWRWSTAATLALATLAASCLTLRGLAGWSSPPASPAEDDPRSFRIPQLAIAQRDRDDQPFDLRFRLPDQFTLTFEVMAEPADLPGIEVLGHKLGVPPNLDPSRTAYRLWHRVRIARAGGSEAVRGRRPADLPRPRPEPKLAPWLTIRPRQARPHASETSCSNGDGRATLLASPHSHPHSSILDPTRPTWTGPGTGRAIVPRAGRGSCNCLLSLIYSTFAMLVRDVVKLMDSDRCTEAIQGEAITSIFVQTMPLPGLTA